MNKLFMTLAIALASFAATADIFIGYDWQYDEIKPKEEHEWEGIPANQQAFVLSVGYIPVKYNWGVYSGYIGGTKETGKGVTATGLTTRELTMKASGYEAGIIYRLPKLGGKNDQFLKVGLQNKDYKIITSKQTSYNTSSGVLNVKEFPGKKRYKNNTAIAVSFTNFWGKHGINLGFNIDFHNGKAKENEKGKEKFSFFEDRTNVINGRLGYTYRF